MALGFVAADPGPSAAVDRPAVVVAVGASGAPEYGAEFRRWAGLWKAAAAKAGAEFLAVGLDEPAKGAGVGGDDREKLRAALAGLSGLGRVGPVWLVLIGHGTVDGGTAKFNLRGPDLTDADLAGWLGAVDRPLAVVLCASAASPFLTRLSGPNRVVVAATRSGDELNYARFGGPLAEALADPAADRDRDGQVSLLEAFLAASARTEEFYRSRSRLATEHALVDDNGDKLGTPADFFQGVRATRKAKNGAAADGLRAHQLHLIPSDRERRMPAEARRRRDALERELDALRGQKSALPEDEYYARLEPLMVELARLYRSANVDPPSRPSPGLK